MRRTSFLFLLLFTAATAFAVEPTVPRGPASGEGLRHVILHVSDALTPEDREELAAKGYVVGRALPNRRYFARVAEGRTVPDERVTSFAPIDPEEKISPSARREARSGRTWADVNVYFHEDVTADEARTALLAAGAALEDAFLLDFAPGQRLTARIAPFALNALAADDRVLGITGPVRFKVAADNARSASLSHVPEVHATPYGLTGAGVTVSLFELAAAQADHPEFGGRLTVMSSVSGGPQDDKDHATHVAGTIGAAGVEPTAKGMAPAARLYQFCVRAGSNTCRNDWLRDKDEELIKLGAKVDNNSWGYILGWESDDYWVWNGFEEFWGAYDLELTSPIDEISLERGILFVHSAGNEGNNPTLGAWGEHRHSDDNGRTITGKLWCYSANGSGSDCPTSLCTGDTNPCETAKHHPQTPYDTIGLVAAAKNAVTVGALISGNAGQIDIVGFSSRGPAKDGRIKPEVVARGFGVLSPIWTNRYATKQGTSMSSPAVAGIAALLVEQWRKTYGNDPDPVQLKALLIAGTEDLGRPGPDFTYGFGLVNAQASVDLILADRSNGPRIHNISVGHGSQQQLPLVVTSAQNVRVTMQWGDPAIPLTPGDFIADKALVNDLDMKVVGPNGAEYFPYVLDKVNFEANATTGVNTVDNTEMIEIPNAAPGTYRVLVTGRDVPEGPQKAVIVANVRGAAACTDLTESKNDDPNNPYGDLVPGQTVYAALCSATDIDHFRWVAQPGQNLSVTFTTGDTPINVTLAGSGSPVTATIPASSTQTITGNVGSGATAFTMSVRAAGTIGAEPTYRFTPTFKQQTGKRRRSV